MKKKILALVATVALAVTTVFGLTACNNNTNNASSLLFGKEVLRVDKQADILTNLENGSCNMGVMDSVMAGQYTKDGKYKKLDFVFSEEKYGIGAKKGNKQLISELNDALITLNNEGKLDEVAITDDFNLKSELCISGQSNPITNPTDKSFDNVKSKKKLIIGYTLFEPIAYNKGGKLTGFDIELARKVVEYWNTKYSLTGENAIVLEATVINWSQKETMLENGSIDLVWNGMTIDANRLEKMEVSIPYMNNAQVAIVKADDYNKYATITDFLKNSKNAIVAVERGSAADALLG